MLMALTSLSLIMSVIVINKYHYCMSPVPKWLLRLSQDGAKTPTKAVLVEKNGTTDVKLPPSEEKQEDTVMKVADNEMIKRRKQWSLAIRKLDRICFGVMIIFSIFLFIVVFVAIGMMSEINSPY